VLAGHFAHGGKGSLFILQRTPEAAARQAVLVVPAFGEEMNKSRRMVTEVALGMAHRGFATVVPDLYGTGDSGGDFADADWSGWLDDLRTVAQWCSEQGIALHGVLATRLGCALAVAASRAGFLPPVSRTVFWQPMFDGGRFVTQFLRIRVAASLMESTGRETVADLREKLRGGSVLEVAGYPVSNALITEIEGLRFTGELPASLGRIHWMSVVSEEGASQPDPSLRFIEQARGKGSDIASQLIVGEPFWTSAETIVVPQMVAATVNALGDA
jgi:exosortase A-associated hydrolase 2